MTTEGKTGDITVVLPSLIATQEFEPTAMMIKVLSIYLESIKQHEKPLSPPDIIAKLGHAKRNWYHWLKKPLFNKWWTKACEEFFTRTGLYNVHSALYRCALLTNCPQDRKVYLDRFDKDYKPATAQDVNYPGVMPPEGIDQAVARSKARALASSQDSPEGVQDGSGGENEAKSIPEAGQEPMQGSTGQGRSGTSPGGVFEGGDDDNNTPTTDFTGNRIVDKEEVE